MEILDKSYDFLDTITLKSNPIIYLLICWITEPSYFYWYFASPMILDDIDRFIEYKEQFPKFIESFFSIISIPYFVLQLYIWFFIFFTFVISLYIPIHIIDIIFSYP